MQKDGQTTRGRKLLNHNFKVVEGSVGDDCQPSAIQPNPTVHLHTYSMPTNTRVGSKGLTSAVKETSTGGDNRRDVEK